MQATWLTRYSEPVQIGAMTPEHIENCLGMIEAWYVDVRDPWGGFTFAEWLLIFRAELLRRARHNFS